MLNVMNPKLSIEAMVGWAPPEARLQGFCDELNAKRDMADGRELARLLEEWMAAPSLRAVLSTQQWGWVLDELRDRADRPVFYPSDDGKWGMYLVSPPGPDHAISGGSGFPFTVRMFGALVTNPLCEKLGGPCARCGDYYIKKRASQKVYCSRSCGNAATAVIRTRERIASEREDKLARAGAWLKKWKPTVAHPDWKRWVAQRTGIDPRFLTRAVNKGDLVPPKKEK
jgi:hypothetical protein